MKHIRDIFNVIENESEPTIRRSNKVNFYTLLNYLGASHKGISKYDMENFLNGNRFSAIFHELLNKSIIEQSQNGNYLLNEQVRSNLFPILEELTSMVYKSKVKSNQIKEESTFEILYDHRSQIFSS